MDLTFTPQKVQDDTTSSEVDDTDEDDDDDDSDSDGMTARAKRKKRQRALAEMSEAGHPQAVPRRLQDVRRNFT